MIVSSDGMIIDPEVVRRGRVHNLARSINAWYYTLVRLGFEPAHRIGHDVGHQTIHRTKERLFEKRVLGL